jgi:hypothetical protein
MRQKQGKETQAFILLIYSIPSIRVSNPLFLFQYSHSPFTIARRRSLARGDLLLPKVLQLVPRINSIFSLFPTSWTNFSMFIGKLESLDNPK